jgi:AraC family transcriptional regulator of adaptative response/methylated-DNA-[protein]-cysteine methyltransferase
MKKNSGLSGPGRLHDLFAAVEAVTPGEFKSRGDGIRIEYGFHPSRFGLCLLGLTQRGICWLSFVNSTGKRAALQELKSHWGGAVFTERWDVTGPVARRIFPGLERRSKPPLNLLLMGTNFQIKVWRALLNIPAGAMVSYQAIGARIGAPRAARAVGAAVGENAISYLIPCHRVIRKSGSLGGYRWGEERKRAMLAWDAAPAQPARVE